MTIFAAFTGFVAGLVHTLAGPDHMAAVAPMAASGEGSKWRTGFKWGLGHSGGAILIGLSALALRDVAQVEIFSAHAERMVGVMLILIGLWGLHKAFTSRIHIHKHEHGDDKHIHVHAHSPKEDHTAPPAHSHTHAALSVGLLHGLAGGSHIFGVIPALAFASVMESVAYLLFFGAGTIVAMMGFASIIGFASERFFNGPLGYKRFMGGLSTSAIVVGAVWLVM